MFEMKVTRELNHLGHEALLKYLVACSSSYFYIYMHIERTELKNGKRQFRTPYGLFLFCLAVVTKWRYQ